MEKIALLITKTSLGSIVSCSDEEYINIRNEQFILR